MALLGRLRTLLLRPEADFSTSPWTDACDAVADVDALIRALQEGHRPDGLDILFAPTGPAQEVSLRSGWGRDFLAMASAYDTAEAAARLS